MLMAIWTAYCIVFCVVFPVLLVTSYTLEGRGVVNEWDWGGSLFFAALWPVFALILLIICALNFNVMET